MRCWGMIDGFLVITISVTELEQISFSSLNRHTRRGSLANKFYQRNASCCAKCSGSFHYRESNDQK